MSVSAHVHCTGAGWDDTEFTFLVLPRVGDTIKITQLLYRVYAVRHYMHQSRCAGIDIFLEKKDG